MATRRDNIHRRGSALIAALLLFGIVACGAGFLYFGMSDSASRESATLENRANAQAYAEYAAELAISNLGDLSYTIDSDGKKVSVERDWVSRNLYGPGKNAYQRRFAGNVGGDSDGYDYRVRVVQVREAKEARDAGILGVAADSWLGAIELPPYNYGKDPVRKFSAAYEITASAKHVQADTKPILGAEGQVQTVVTMGYQSAYNDLDRLATLHVDQPSQLMTYSDQVVATAGGGPVGITGSPNFEIPASENLHVSGEDHYATKTMAKTGIIDNVVEGLLRITALSTEFFSIYNNWWTYGKQTVQFMVGDTPNPNIPRTRKMGSSLIDRQMISLDPDREPDIYFNGGKVAGLNANVDRFFVNSGWVSRHYKGRTVTVGEDGLIVETTEAQVNPTTQGLKNQKSLAVGSPDDFMKLYFNYVEPFNAGSWVSDNAAKPAVDNWKQNQWRQVMFAHHPRNATIINTPVAQDVPCLYAAPNDNWRTPRRRRFPLLIMPMNSDGAMLIREYDGAGYNNPKGGSSTPPNAWYGTYTWMYRLGITHVSGTYNVRGYDGTWIKPTQENGINAAKAMAARKLTLQEFIGYEMECDADGIPAKFDGGGNIIAGVPEFRRDGSGNRIPYEPEGAAGKGSNFHESFQRQNTVDNWGINATTLSMMPPLDGIYVRLPETDPEFNSGFPGGTPSEGYWQAPAARAGDGVKRRYKRYQNLREFAFLRNVAGPSEPEDMREVSSVFLSFDTNHEDDADYFYYLLELSASIVWPTRTVVASDDPGELFRHWWEGDPQEGLTGKQAHVSISGYASEEIRNMTDPDRLQEFYKTLGLYNPATPSMSIPGVNTMVDASDQLTGFNKVDFEVVVGEADIGNLVIDTNTQFNDANEFFYGDDELWAVATALYSAKGLDMFTTTQKDELVQLKNDGMVDEYNTKWTEYLKVQATERINNKAAAAGKHIYHITKRFDSADREKTVLSKDVPAGQMDKVLMIESDVNGRSLSLMTFGDKKYNVPAVYANLKSDGTLERMSHNDFDPAESATPVPSVKSRVSFLPGEFNLDPTDGTVFPEFYSYSGMPPFSWVDLMYRKTGAVQPNGRLIEPRFVWKGEAPSGHLKLADIHKSPDWFRNDPDTGENLEQVMLRGNGTPGLTGYNMEHRGALGWHREGPGAMTPETVEDPYNKELYKKIFGDHYEFVVMSSWDPKFPFGGMYVSGGFIPYYTMHTTAPGERTGYYLALMRPEDEDPLTPPDKSTFAPRLLPSDQMPTFVIEGKELDGAGILVVNGNLHVKTRFAYHGLLIVLGDVLIEPTYQEKFDHLGNRLNADNEPIADSNGVWYLIDPQTGNWIYDSEQNPIKSTGPANEWLGSLIVQGKMVVGGKTRVTAEEIGLNGDVVRPAGVLDIRASEQAIEDTMGLWIKVGPNEKFATGRVGWNAGGVTNIDSSALWE